MRAVVLTAHGSMDKLVFHNDWPVPKPDNNEVLIKVTACGMNNTDVNTRSGWYSKAASARSQRSDDRRSLRFGWLERPMLAATYPIEDFHAAQQAFIDKRHA